MDKDKLAKVLGMLGSKHDPEVVVAARKAQEMVAAAGLSWAEVVTPSEALGATDLKARFLAIDRNLRRLSKLDQSEFSKLRDRWFERGDLVGADERRLAYFSDLVTSGADDIPF